MKINTIANTIVNPSFKHYLNVFIWTLRFFVFENLMMSWRAWCYLVKWLIHLKFKYCRHRRCSSSPWPGPGTGCVWYYQAGLRIRLRRMTHASPTHKHPWLRCSRRVHIYFIVISTSWGLHWAQWHHGPGAETDAELNTYLPQHEYLWMLPWLQRSSQLTPGLWTSADISVNIR